MSRKLDGKMRLAVHPDKIFELSLTWIINILIVYIIIVLFIGLTKTLFEMRTIISSQPIGEGFAQVVTDILTFLVIIELFRGFIEYFKAKRFRLHNMMDPSIVFVIRELIISLYNNHHPDWKILAGFGILIVSLGIVRTLAVRFSPKDDGEKVLQNS